MFVEVGIFLPFFMPRPVRWKFAAKAAHGDKISPTRFFGGLCYSLCKSETYVGNCRL